MCSNRGLGTRKMSRYPRIVRRLRHFEAKTQLLHIIKSSKPFLRRGQPLKSRYRHPAYTGKSAKHYTENLVIQRSLAKWLRVLLRERIHIRLKKWRKLFPSERISSCEDRRLTYIIVFQRGMWFISTSNSFVHTLSPYDDALSLWIEMRITSFSIVGFSMPIPLTNRTKQSDHPCPSPSSVNCWKSIAQEWTISIRRFQGKREGEPDHRDLLMKSIREDG